MKKTTEIDLIKSDIENCNLDILRIKKSLKERKAELVKYKTKLVALKDTPS